MKASLSISTALSALTVAAVSALMSSATLAADGVSLLSGKVVSSGGEALAGIPIKARRDNSPMTIAVYTDAKGEYAFPDWSELKPGSYSIAVDLPDFERVTRPVTLSDGKATT